MPGRSRHRYRQGIRPGEKIHELLISRDEARNTLDVGKFYVIKPAFPYWSTGNWSMGRPVPEDGEYASDNNEHWLGVEELRGCCNICYDVFKALTIFPWKLKNMKDLME